MKKMKAKRKYDFKGVREGERERESKITNLLDGESLRYFRLCKILLVSCILRVIDRVI